MVCTSPIQDDAVDSSDRWRTLSNSASTGMIKEACLSLRTLPRPGSVVGLCGVRPPAPVSDAVHGENTADTP